MKNEKDIIFFQIVCIICTALLAATIILLGLINQFMP
jgi:hypothetical protein